MTMHEPLAIERSNTPVSQTRRFLSFKARILGNGTDTGGLHVVELELPSGEESPWHVHHQEHEWFYVIEGEILAIVGDTRITLSAGEFAFGPRHVPHGFRVTSPGTTRLLLVTEGGNFSNFIAENSTPIADDAKLDHMEPDMDRLVASAKRYGQEIFGALPD